ncbi:MAG: hypothetical protein HY901_02730 [Deltaproteobacteria bacterium]|nr:hypothetical protein [Deltaproteobacteria bacterium]
MSFRMTAGLLLALAASPALAQTPRAPTPAAARQAAVPAVADASDLAQRWGLDFSGIAACQDKNAGSGIAGFGRSFEYVGVARKGTLMSTLGLAAQIVRMSCLTSDSYSRFYCGALPYLFGSDPKAQSKETRAAIQKERITTRDFVKRFGAASRAERRELVQSVIAQFEKCGRQDELSNLAALMYQGLDDYERAMKAGAGKACPAGCDPRSKPDWGTTITFRNGQPQYPSTGRCFAGCNAEPEDSSLVVRFIHRRVLQGISVEEMRELAALMPGTLAQPQDEVGTPGSNLHWRRCAVGQTWDGTSCTGFAQALTSGEAANACPAGYRLPEPEEFEALLGASPKTESPVQAAEGDAGVAEQARPALSCEATPACASLFGSEDRTFWSQPPQSREPQVSADFRTGRLAAQRWTKLLVRCLRSGPPVPPELPAAVLKAVPGLWLQVAAGGGHTCGIKADHGLYCWGQNNEGQLGDGNRCPGSPFTCADKNAPTKIGDDTWIAVSAGGGHSCGINTQKQLHCWGYGKSGQLGDNSSAGATKPTRIEGEGWLQVAAGRYYTCGIKADHKLYCWGANSGQLGDGTINDRSVPRQIGNESWITVSAGSEHTCGIKMADRKLYCWGNNDSGQLGTGTVERKLEPTAIGDDQWLSVSLGGEYAGAYACGVKTADRRLYCWGNNSKGQLGLGTTTGEKVPANRGEEQWSQVAAGKDFACGLSADSKLYCWGSNVSGRLGNGSRTLYDNSYHLLANHDRQVPTRAGDDSWSALSAGSAHACAIRAADQNLFCWGSDQTGQLGDGAGGAATGKAVTASGTVAPVAAVDAGQPAAPALPGDAGAPPPATATATATAEPRPADGANKPPLAAFPTFVEAVEGAAWAPLPSPEGAAVRGLIIHGKALFAATEQRLMRSTDGGASWVESPGIAEPWSLAANRTTLFVATRQHIFRSTDQGDTWSELPLGELAKDEFNFGPMVATEKALLVPANRIGLLRHDGSAWKPVRVPGASSLPLVVAADGGRFYTFSGDKLWSLDDQSEEFVEAGGSKPFEQTEGLVVSGKKLYALGDWALRAGKADRSGRPNTLLASSADGGRSWKYSTCPGGHYLPGSKPVLARGAVFVAGLDGVFSTRDQGQSWKPLGKGLPGTWEAKALLLTEKAALAGDAQGLQLLDPKTNLWKPANSGLGHGLRILKIAPLGAEMLQLFASRQLYRCSDAGCSLLLPGVDRFWVLSDGAILASTPWQGSALRTSRDGGVTWLPAQGLPANDGLSEVTGNSAALYARTTLDLFVSHDGGLTWQPGSAPSCGRSCRVDSLLAVGSHLYAAATAEKGSFLWRSADGMRTWSSVPGLVPKEPPVFFTAMAADAHALYVSAATDGNRTFRLGLEEGPGSEAREVLVSKEVGEWGGLLVNGRQVFSSFRAGGLLVSGDDGATWARFATQPPAGLSYLLLHDGALYGVLFGGSAARLPIRLVEKRPPPPLSLPSVGVGLVLPKGGARWTRTDGTDRYDRLIATVGRYRVQVVVSPQPATSACSVKGWTGPYGGRAGAVVVKGGSYLPAAWKSLEAAENGYGSPAQWTSVFCREGQGRKVDVDIKQEGAKAVTPEVAAALRTLFEAFEAALRETPAAAK